LLIKGGAAMEKAARIKAFAFDKTGTLTVGKPEVVDVIVFDGINKTDLLSMAAAVEKDAGHVLGDAIVTHAKQQGLEIVQATDVRALPGLGAQGFVGDGQILVGSHRLFHERQLCSGPMCDAAKDLESSANNLVFVGDEVEGKGIIVLADTVRENAAESLAELRKAGIEHLAMVSGDNKQAAQAIGQSLGIDEIWAERLPENKVDVIRQMQADYGAIAMVGDGINDAPALAASDIGIAMGAGTDQALETADAALISGELTRLPTLVRLSKKTVGRIKANIAIALGIKGAFMVMAGLGVATLWMAVFADTGASLIVIANGLRMLKYEDPPKA
jgi:Cd2+/Zn2+-exporting ATPase